MQLYILDKDPIKSAQLVPDKYKFKMLIELGQLICSAGISDAYKRIPQGKELQEWVSNNTAWTYFYYKELYYWCINNINMKESTIYNIKIILNSIYNPVYCYLQEPTRAYFRYAKEYECNVPSKTLLPIEDCISEYKKYLEWKISA